MIMPHNSFVSIIMPAYNAEKYIATAIESVLNQSYLNWELYIIDDCSSDSTSQIIKEYVEKDSRIKSSRLSERYGIGLVRNAGIKKIFESTNKTKYVAWIDADDIYHPKFLEILYYYISKFDCDIVECQSETFEDIWGFSKFNFDKNKELFFEDGEMFIKKWFEGKHKTSLWSKIYKKELFDNFSFPDEVMLEETYFYHSSANKIQRVVSLPYVLYGYRNTTGSLSRRFDSKYLTSLINGIENSLQEADKYPDTLKETVYISLINRLYHNWMLTIYAKTDINIIHRIENLIEEILKQSTNPALLSNKDRFMFQIRKIPGYYKIRYTISKLRSHKNTL